MRCSLGIALLFVCLLVTNLALARDGMVLEGNKDITDQKFESNLEIINANSSIKNIKVKGDLKVSGKINMENSSVDGDFEGVGATYMKDVKLNAAKIQGDVKINGLEVEQISIKGSLDANNLVVSNGAKVLGKTSVNNSKIYSMTASTDVAKFNNSSVDELIVASPSSKNEIVEVSGKSNIAEITFYSKAGKVIVSGPDVKIGNVHGGIVENK